MPFVKRLNLCKNTNAANGALAHFVSHSVNASVARMSNFKAIGFADSNNYDHSAFPMVFNVIKNGAPVGRAACWVGIPRGMFNCDVCGIYIDLKDSAHPMSNNGIFDWDLYLSLVNCKITNTCILCARTIVQGAAGGGADRTFSCISRRMSGPMIAGQEIPVGNPSAHAHDVRDPVYNAAAALLARGTNCARELVLPIPTVVLSTDHTNRRYQARIGRDSVVARLPAITARHSFAWGGIAGRVGVYDRSKLPTGMISIALDVDRGKREDVYVPIYREGRSTWAVSFGDGLVADTHEDMLGMTSPVLNESTGVWLCRVYLYDPRLGFVTPSTCILEPCHDTPPVILSMAEVGMHDEILIHKFHVLEIQGGELSEEYAALVGDKYVPTMRMQPKTTFGSSTPILYNRHYVRSTCLTGMPTPLHGNIVLRRTLSTPNDVTGPSFNRYVDFTTNMSGSPVTGRSYYTCSTTLPPIGQLSLNAVCHRLVVFNILGDCGHDESDQFLSELVDVMSGNTEKGLDGSFTTKTWHYMKHKAEKRRVIDWLAVSHAVVVHKDPAMSAYYRYLASMTKHVDGVSSSSYVHVVDVRLSGSHGGVDYSIKSQARSVYEMISVYVFGRPPDYCYADPSDVWSYTGDGNQYLYMGDDGVYSRVDVELPLGALAEMSGDCDPAGGGILPMRAVTDGVAARCNVVSYRCYCCARVDVCRGGRCPMKGREFNLAIVNEVVNPVLMPKAQNSPAQARMFKLANVGARYNDAKVLVPGSDVTLNVYPSTGYGAFIQFLAHCGGAAVKSEGAPHTGDGSGGGGGGGTTFVKMSNDPPINLTSLTKGLSDESSDDEDDDEPTIMAGGGGAGVGGGGAEAAPIQEPTTTFVTDGPVLMTSMAGAASMLSSMDSAGALEAYVVGRAIFERVSHRSYDKVLYKRGRCCFGTYGHRCSSISTHVILSKMGLLGAWPVCVKHYMCARVKADGTLSLSLFGVERETMVRDASIISISSTGLVEGDNTVIRAFVQSKGAGVSNFYYMDNFNLSSETVCVPQHTRTIYYDGLVTPIAGGVEVNKAMIITDVTSKLSNLVKSYRKLVDHSDDEINALGNIVVGIAVGAISGVGLTHLASRNSNRPWMELIYDGIDPMEVINNAIGWGISSTDNWEYLVSAIMSTAYTISILPPRFSVETSQVDATTGVSKVLCLICDSPGEPSDGSSGSVLARVNAQGPVKLRPMGNVMYTVSMNIWCHIYDDARGVKASSGGEPGVEAFANCRAFTFEASENGDLTIIMKLVSDNATKGNIICVGASTLLYPSSNNYPRFVKVCNYSNRRNTVLWDRGGGMLWYKGKNYATKAGVTMLAPSRILNLKNCGPDRIDFELYYMDEELIKGTH